jgi:hypothetical protein
MPVHLVNVRNLWQAFGLNAKARVTVLAVSMVNRELLILVLWLGKNSCVIVAVGRGIGDDVSSLSN